MTAQTQNQRSRTAAQMQQWDKHDTSHQLAALQIMVKHQMTAADLVRIRLRHHAALKTEVY